jgi:phage tail tape-measure protein
MQAGRAAGGVNPMDVERATQMLRKLSAPRSRPERPARPDRPKRPPR